MFEEIGLSLESWMAQEVEDATAAVRAQLDSASFAEAWEAGRNMTLEDAIELAVES